MKGGSSLEVARPALLKITRQIYTIVEAIKDGLYQSAIKTEMERLDTREA